MLKRICQVKGIGLLHDADAKAFGLKKATLVYADNGRGKSTLASIFRSCSVNNAELILNRRTIDGVNNPEVLLLFDNGQKSTFFDASWDSHRPEIVVFDADFVEQNVYAGGQVTTDQRKNLLNFALGAEAVVAQRDYDVADDDARTASESIRVTTNQLSVIHNGMTLAQFENLVKVADADSQIAVLNEKIVEAQKIGLIQEKASPKTLEDPKLNVEPIFKVLATSLANIDLAAEKRVKDHLDTHKKPKLEKWISDGYAFGEVETCLFCNQSMAGVDLLGAYRSYFNQDYNNLKASVAQLDAYISKCSADAILDRLKATFVTAEAAIESWQEHLDIPSPVFDDAAARRALGEIRATLEGLKQSKEIRLLDAVGSEKEQIDLLEKWKVIEQAVNSCNQSILQAVRLITDYKEKLAAVSIESLKLQISSLEWAKTRHRKEVISLFSQLTRDQTLDLLAKAEKQAKKDALNQVMQSTLENYRDRINGLLSSFGAQFIIPKIDFNYRGGLRSDYVLQMRGSSIELNGGIPDFKTSLSEGDKRTLAFAFFIASAEADLDLSKKIIVIDDPMCEAVIKSV